MHPVLFRIGSFPIYAYTAFLDLGILLGIALVCLAGRQRGFQVADVLDAALWSLAGGIIGGRVAYILPNWSQYAARPSAILDLWGGGLAFHGALFGGAAAIWLYAQIHFPSFWDLADLAALGLPLGQAFGWLGALFHGSNYGVVAYKGWAWELPDLYGITVPRFPTQAVGSAIALVLFLLQLLLSRRRMPSGAAFSIYLLSNSLAYFLLEFTRGDGAAHWGPLRLAQVVYLLETLLSLGLCAYLWRARRNPAASQESWLCQEG